jgi:hypothetical protein
VRRVALALSIALLLPSLEAAAKPTHFDGGITMDVPDGWAYSAPTSNMRLGQWKAGDAEMVLYYFGGDGQGGTADQNVARWVDQWQNDKGEKARAKIDKKTVGAVTVTRVEVAGRYVAAVRPGAEEKFDKPKHAMLAAVIDSPGGPHFIKLIGPEKTIAKETKAFDRMIASIKADPKS